METEGEVKRMHDEAIDVANAMRERGGGFVQALGEAILRADPINVFKLKQAFPEYWEQYKRYAENKDGKM